MHAYRVKTADGEVAYVLAHDLSACVRLLAEFDYFDPVDDCPVTFEVCEATDVVSVTYETEDDAPPHPPSAATRHHPDHGFTVAAPACDWCEWAEDTLTYSDGHVVCSTRWAP